MLLSILNISTLESNTKSKVAILTRVALILTTELGIGTDTEIEYSTLIYKVKIKVKVPGVVLRHRYRTEELLGHLTPSPTQNTGSQRGRQWVPYLQSL